MTYPILVEHFPDGQSLRIVCESCHAERTITADEIRNEMDYTCAKCGGWAVYKYEVADKCPGCSKLGFWNSTVLSGCCSRKCLLQVEYAHELAERETAV